MIYPGEFPQGSQVSLAAWGEHRLLISIPRSGIVEALDLRTGESVARFTAPNPIPGMPASWDPTEFGAVILSRGEEVVVMAPADALSPSSPADFSGGGAVYVFSSHTE